MKKPKLALIPSAYADGKVISVMPTNGSGDFDFTRGSGATRINKDGLIETIAEELGDELVTNGSFAADSDWAYGSGWSIGGGVATYDDSVTSVLSSSSISLSTSKYYVLSFTISNGSGARLQFTNEAAQGLYDLYSLGNLDNGNHSFVVNPINPATSIRFYGYTLSGGSFDLDNVSVKEVLSGFDTPRLEYPMIDGVVSGCPSLLLEPQRTNLVTYSEDFSDSSWVSSGTNPPVLTPYQFISPDGTQNASRLEIPITNTTSILQQLFSHTIGQEYTVSAYVKSNSISNQEFKLYGDYGSPTGISGVLIATSEWQRFTFTYTATGTGSRSGGFYYVPNTNTDIQIYGFQAEEGSYSTSYIPTNGSATTRLAETCNNSGDASTFNDSEGVLMVEAATLLELLTQNHIIGIHDGTINNRVNIYWREDVPSELIFSVIYGGVEIYTYTTTSIALDDMNKISLRYGSNNFSAWANGFKLDEQTSGGSVNLGLNTLDFNWALGTANEAFYGKTKQIQYFQTALTDSELEELTSWDSFKVMAIAQLYNIE